MRKSLLLLLLITFFPLIQYGQLQEIDVNHGKTEVVVLSQNNFDIRLKANVSKLISQEISTRRGNFITLSFESSKAEDNFGYPELPVFTELIEIPFGGKASVKVISFDEKIIDINQSGTLSKIFPSQPPLAKNQDPDKVKFHYIEKVYSTDDYLINNIASVEEIGTMRGKKIGKLIINPCLYNPVQNLLKIRTNMVVEVSFENADLTSTRNAAEKYHSPVFEKPFGQLLNNQINTKEQIVSYPVKYVIVSDPMFQTTLQQFVAWKTKKGFNVVEAYTNNPLVGNTTTSIKNYLQGLYNAATTSDPAPSFVLIVGDVAQVPAFSMSGHVSDLYYCEYDGGGDYLPDAYYGRFSATNIEQLQPQIDKTLEYEQYLMPQPSFLDTVVLVSGVDASMAPTYGNGQINYGTTYYFNAAHGIYSNTYLYPASGSAATQIRNDVSDGCSFANYTAHGSSSGWADPSFTVSHVSSMTNANKYPLMIGNACVTNKFDVSVCFGEALLRAANKGALGYIGASNNTYWTGDYYWGVGVGTVTANPTYSGTGLGVYDRTFHDNGEPESDWYPTQGQMIHAGNLAVSAGQSTSTAQYYWEIYHLMGDPSLMVYFSVPSAMSVSYPSSVQVGTSTLQVTTESYAYVALSQNGVLLDAQYTGSTGIANLSFPAFSSPGLADIVVTKQNRQPFIGTIDVIPGNTPFINIQSVTVNDAIGNNNGQADYGESIYLNLNIENIGSQPASNVIFTVNTTDPYLSFSDSTENLGIIAASATVTATNAILFDIANNIPDQHTLIFAYEITATGGYSWTGSFTLDVNAPQLTTGAYYIDDTSLGNGDGILDAGETASFVIESGNNGNSTCYSVLASLTTNNSLVSITNPSVNLGTLTPGTSTTTTFIIQADTGIAVGTEVIFTYSIQSGAYNASVNISEYISIMQGSYCIPSSNCAGYGDEIDDFSFHTINQTATGCGTDGYSDFSSISTTLERQGTYTMSLTTNYQDQNVSVWIDFNNDSNFDISERLLLDFNLPTTGTTYSTDITIPSNANLGSHRMRVRCRWSSSCTDPCTAYSYGEAHDYTVMIINPTSQPPSVSLCFDLSICEGSNFTLIPSVSGGLTPYNYNWSTGETSTSITVTPLAATLYSLTVSDANSNSGSDEVLISLYNLPTVNLGADQTILQGSSITLDAGSGFVSYLWNTGESTQSISVSDSGTYTVTVMDANSCSNSDEVIVTVIMSPGPGWNYGITATNHTILIPDFANYDFDGNTIQVGDYVGVFYDSIGILACGGYHVWTGATASLTAWGADVGNDGFAAAETFKWKIWRVAAETEYSATATYIQPPVMPNTGTFTVNGMSGLESLSAITLSNQNLLLAQGWSIISSFIVPADPDMSSVFAPVVNDLVIVKDGYGNPYWPQFGINAIGDIDATQGYQINMAAQHNLTLTGTAANPVTTPLNIPQGWSMISYLNTVPGDIETMLSSIYSSIVIVKDGMGNPYWPAWGINLIVNMQPGSGYQINITSSQTFYYPVLNLASKLLFINPKPEFYNQDINTGSNMTLCIPAHAWEIKPQNGAEIGIFSQEGDLVGSGLYQNKNLAICIWGPDQLKTQNHGLNPLEQFHIKIYDGEEHEVKVHSWIQGDDKYSENKLSVVNKIRNDQIESLLVYPNPFKNKSTVEFHIPQDGYVQIELFSSIGQQLDILTNREYRAGTYHIPLNAENLSTGCYFIRFESNGIIENKVVQILK